MEEVRSLLICRLTRQGSSRWVGQSLLRQGLLGHLDKKREDEINDPMAWDPRGQVS